MRYICTLQHVTFCEQNLLQIAKNEKKKKILESVDS